MSLLNTSVSAANIQGTMSQVADGMVPVAKAPITTPTLGYEGKGKALAVVAIDLAIKRANDWKNIYKSLLDLENLGRTAFIKDVTAAVKTPKNGDDILKATQASAKVRLSEVTTIAKALNMGHTMHPDWAFHYAVGSARTYQRSKGMGSNRGRTAKSLQERFKAWLLKNCPTNDAVKVIQEEVVKYSVPA